jgi:hypothetical protein
VVSRDVTLAQATGEGGGDHETDHMKNTRNRRIRVRMMRLQEKEGRRRSRSRKREDVLVMMCPPSARDTTSPLSVKGHPCAWLDEIIGDRSPACPDFVVVMVSWCVIPVVSDLTPEVVTVGCAVAILQVRNMMGYSLNRSMLRHWAIFRLPSLPTVPHQVQYRPTKGSRTS